MFLLKGRESQTKVGHEGKKRVHTYVVCACVSVSCTLNSLGAFVLIMSQSMYSNDITRNLIVFVSVLLSSVLFYSKILLKS